jgi:hypothetical protein
VVGVVFAGRDGSRRVAAIPPAAAAASPASLIPTK